MANRREIEHKIKRLEDELAVAKRELVRADRECNHDWSEPVADHIYKESYTIQGDKPGTMGVDWRGPVHVPASTTHRWKRTCKNCGKKEHTTRTSTKTTTTETPQF